MQDLSEGLLQIKMKEDEVKTSMQWFGECININPTTILNPYFDELLEKVNKSKNLEIDFCKLQYMKSSTVPYLVKLITRLNKQKVDTKILYNSISKWQTATFKALMSVVAIMDHIELVGVETKNIT